MACRYFHYRVWLLLLATLALLAAGCTSARIDPTGRQILTTAPTQPGLGTAPVGTIPITVIPGSNLPAPTLVPLIAQPGVSLTPGRLVAPVGNEVLLVGAAHQAGRPQAPYERIEWLLSPTGVGTFLAVAESDRPFFARYWAGPEPRKLDNHYAVSETAALARVLTRGTVDRIDDVTILPGQCWLTMTSPVEGVSYVTAYAPNILGATSNRQTAAIYWVDARWTLLPTVTAPVGGAIPLVATVYRQTSGQPIANWRIRFTISGGPPANFSAGGAQSVEVATNSAGQAAADLTQAAPGAGSNLITVELIRPTEAAPGATEPLIVGTATSQVTWTEAAIAPLPGTMTPGTASPVTSPPGTFIPPVDNNAPVTGATPLRLELRGPERGAVNEAVAYELDITNTTSRPLENVILRDQLDPGWRHTSGENPITRNISTIPAGQTVTVPIRLIPTQAGQLCQTITAETADRQRVATKKCFIAGAAGQTGTVPPGGVGIGPAFKVALRGPGREMELGQDAKFVVELVNTGDAVLPEVNVAVKFDPELRLLQSTFTEPQYGFKQDVNNNVLTYTFKNIGPRQSLPQALEIVVKASKLTAPGKQACAFASATSGNVPLADQACVMITPPRAAAPTAGSKTELTITRNSPQQVRVGTEHSLAVLVVNNGSAPDRDIRLAISLPEQVSVNQNDVQTILAFKLDGKTLVFDPIPELAPRETRTVTIKFKTEQAGNGQFQARAITTEQPAGVTAQEALQIYVN